MSQTFSTKRTNTIYTHLEVARYGTPAIKQLAMGLPFGVVVAGGYARYLLDPQKRPVNDLDVFIVGADSAARAVDAIENYWTPGPVKTVRENLDEWPSFPNANYNKIQLIRKVFESAEAIIDCFDLTVCQFAITNTEIVYRPEAFYDLVHTSNFTQHHETPNFPQRVEKYASKGFNFVQPASISPTP